MEDKTVKRGRPRILSDEEKRKRKTKYMLNKEWSCWICRPIKNYTLAGKTCHLKTKKHRQYQQLCDNLVNVTTGKLFKGIM